MADMRELWNDFFRSKNRRRYRPGEADRRLTRLKVLTIAASVFLIGIVSSVLIVIFLFAWYGKDLPRPDKVRRVEGLSTIIYDKNGTSLYDIYGDENRIPIELTDIPEALKEATIAIEDKDFYKHPGLSTAGILRAVINIFVFRNFQGGSTLTQQLVKTVLLTNERSLPRKIKEAILAIQIERKYSKDEILQMYLNEAPYGGPAVGVEAAAQYYFGKHAKDLTFLQSVIIAGLPQSPTRYNPYTATDEKAYIWRAEQVLRRMREDSYITDEEEADAKSKLAEVTFGREDKGLKAPHFVAYVRDILVDQFGEQLVESGGLRVTTTLDWDLQQEVEKIAKEEIEKLKDLKVSNGAAVVLDPKTGEILAMVGSKDYNAPGDGFKFNVVTQGLRQPGSAIKPIAYATALQKGYTLATVLMDVDTKYPSGDPTKPEYNPQNYDEKFRGPMSLRMGLANSINTTAVKITALVGVKNVLEQAYAMGLSTLEPTDANLRRFGLSLALGGGEVKLLELTSAFGVFATGGERVPPVAIKKVETLQGKVLYEYKNPPGARVLSPDIAYLISSTLSDNDARATLFGTRSLLRIPNHSVAVKTGTTDDKRDNWAVGYTPDVVVGTWVGNNDNSPMHKSLASGITGATPLWNKIMTHILKDQKDKPFEKPNSIVEVEIDALTGGLPIDGQKTRKEFFIKGTEPASVSPIFQNVKLSIKDSNKLANPVDIAKDEFTLKPYYVFKEEDPVSTDGKNRWQEAIDAWVGSQSDDRFKVPTEVYSAQDPIVVIIKEPGDNSRINSNTVRVRAEATAVEEVAKIEVFVNGNLVKDTNGKSMSEEISITNGSHTIRVKATDVKGRSTERTVKVGINEDYKEAQPTPQPTQSPNTTP